ncbi:anti-sigma factor RsbA family regulatory protein [Embleya sp. NPDC056575]|uniref:anti-sigma factor RsbA family regulatory protein n=1 Tax=unclassified Embleya TaxID=2699296 RepID=UPI0036D19E57
MDAAPRFRHEALLYAGLDDFVERTAAFVRAGLRAGEAVAVAVIESRAGALRKELAADADLVTWIDMERVGRNPARIIPTWREWTAAQGPRGRRGVAEPIWVGRDAAELVECGHHEVLLDLAFAGEPWWLLCPYDVSGLHPEVITEARRAHPPPPAGATGERCSRPDAEVYAATLRGPPLPAAPGHAERLAFRAGELAGVRTLVRRTLPDATRIRVDHALLAIGEITGNSVVHGGAAGTIVVWSEGAHLFCDVHDAGRITDPLAGRHRPTTDQDGGRGLWIANQICDLVQIRSTETGTTVRLRLRVSD